MDKIEIENQIDHFIQNEMTPDERQMFCLLMEEDEELKQLVAIRYSLMEGMLHDAEQKAKQALLNPTHRPKHRIIQWSAVACILFLLGGAYWFGNSPQYIPQEIYLKYHTIPVVERARAGNGLTGEIANFNEQIIRLYEEGNYPEIVELFETSVSMTEWKALPDYTLLYISISLLEQNDIDKAISILSNIHGSEYKEEVDWLLLNCYLKKNERQKAIEQARKIQINLSVYIDDAKQIEMDLKKKKWF